MASRRDTEFVEFVGACEQRLQRTAYLLLGDRNTATDVVAEALAGVYVDWPTLERSGDLSAFARRAVVSAAVGHPLRRWTRDHVTRIPYHPERHVEDGDLLLSTLQHLPARERACVVLRYYEELSVAETAEVLNCSAGAVRNHTTGGVDLSELLQDRAEDSSGHGIDPYAVLAEGRRRVRRRRVLATSGTVAVILLVVLTASLGRWWSTPATPEPDGTGRFAKVQVSRADAVSRCHTQLRNAGDNGAFILLDAVRAADGTVIGQPQPPWYEGTQLYFTLKSSGRLNDPLPRVCTVPQRKLTAWSGTVSQPAATAADVDAFRDQCGAYAGIDLTGWAVADSATSSVGGIALFLARNGYTLRCRQVDRHTGFGITLGVLHDAPVRGAPASDHLGGRTIFVGCEPPLTGLGERGVCFGAGEAYDNGDVGSLRVRLPDGRLEQVQAKHGFYAFMFDVASNVSWERYLTTKVTALTPEGSQMESYPVEPLPSETPLVTS